MGAVLCHRGSVYGGDALGQHISQRRALFDAWRIVMGIAGKARGRLSGHQKLGKLGVAFVKLYIISGDFLKQRYCLLVALVLVVGKTHKDLNVTWFGDQPSLPARIREVFE